MGACAVAAKIRLVVMRHDRSRGGFGAGHLLTGAHSSRLISTGAPIWLAAWLVTILRNRFRDQYRRRQREVEDTDGYYAGTLNSQPEQSARIDFAEFRAALAKLPPQQRQALILVGTSDLSYDDAAARCGCAAGTLKSRVHRARARLIDLLAIDGADDLGPDRTTRAVMANRPISPWR
jgi:RNA polymerase sigma-70 factor (ECF subfamily)